MPIFTCFTIPEAVSGTVMIVCVCECESVSMCVFVFISLLHIFFNQLWLFVHSPCRTYACCGGVAFWECHPLYPPPLFAHCWCPAPFCARPLGFQWHVSLIWWHPEHVSLHNVRCCYPNLWSGNVSSMESYWVLLTIEYIEPFWFQFLIFKFKMGIK